MHFTWQGFDKLVPTLIGPDAKGGGMVDFTLHALKGLSADYDGVITFFFDEYPTNRRKLSLQYRGWRHPTHFARAGQHPGPVRHAPELFARGDFFHRVAVEEDAARRLARCLRRIRGSYNPGFRQSHRRHGQSHSARRAEWERQIHPYADHRRVDTTRFRSRGSRARNAYRLRSSPGRFMHPRACARKPKKRSGAARPS